jgi:hypothetical protein
MASLNEVYKPICGQTIRQWCDCDWVVTDSKYCLGANTAVKCSKCGVQTIIPTKNVDKKNRTKYHFAWNNTTYVHEDLHSPE